MEELLIILADAMPEVEIIKKIHDSSAKYLLDSSEESKGELRMNCLLLTVKASFAGSNPMDAIKEVHNLRKASELLSPNQN